MTSTRLIAGFAGLAVLLPALIWGGPVAVVIIVAIAMAIALAEFAAMAFPDDRRFAFGWLVLWGYPLAYASVAGPLELLASIGAIGLIATMIQVTLRPGPELAHAADRIGRYALGAAWIAGLLPFLARLRALEEDVLWVVLALAVSWLGDTGAYFAGRAFGAHALYPRVSPKKTWEGLAGGVLAAVIGVGVLRAAWLPQLGVLDVIVLGAAGCVAGVLGDLSESLLKRAFDVKDSGWILPGHGGILDRIDSLLFVAPTVWVWATWSMGI